MSQTHAPVQLYDLFKSCMIIFLLQAAIVLLTTTIGVVDVTLRFLILLLNVVVSGLLGWQLYKRTYHMVFTYDNTGFTLRKGKKEENSQKWSEFFKVSLVRNESGGFSVRLYHNSEFFDLPASKLKLNAFDFRVDVTKLVAAGKNRRHA